MKKKMLITGGSGFLGRHLVAALAPEYELFYTVKQTQKNDPRALVMDITSMEEVKNVFHKILPDIVIHAAAVSSPSYAEKNSEECRGVNITGSKNIVAAAQESKVSLVIGISSVRAASPAEGIYGSSKAEMERIFTGVKNSGTKFCCVRLGNIAWSTGSVFQSWKKMTEETGVIHTTGFGMSRFFLSVSEAVKMIKTAIEYGDELRGKILVDNMKSASIADLLEAWAFLKKTSWEKSAPRSEEKKEETLVGEAELKHTIKKMYHNRSFFVVDLYEEVNEPLAEPVTTGNGAKYSRNEILALLSEGLEKHESSK